MTGSSLWLLPPLPLRAPLQTLISTTLPAHYPSHTSSPLLPASFFPPHVTLTSGIDPAVYGADPQGWLDSIPFERAAGGEKKKPRVRFEGVASQEVFFRRCFVRVGFGGVAALAGVARARGVVGEEVGEGGEDGGVVLGGKTREWLEKWRREFGPHLSLMYGDEPISDQELKDITRVVQEAGVKLADEPEGNQEGAWEGWEGGVIWLVPTDKPISEWGTPIATRQL